MPAIGSNTPKEEPKTQKELSHRLHYSVSALSAWSKLPGAPTGLDIGEWKAFIKANDLGIAGSRMGKGREALLEEKLKSEIRLNELKIQKEEGKTVLVSEVDERDLQLATLMKSYLYSVLGRELGARGAGKSAEELCVLGQNIADQICDVFTRGVEKWQKSTSG